MKKKRLRIVFQILGCVVLCGLFAAFIFSLNRSETEVEEPGIEWEAQAGEQPDEWQKVAENDKLELFYQPAQVQLLVKDKNTGTEWRSNPEDALEDKIAFGQNKTLVRSLLDVTYVDDQSCFYTVNNYQGSVMEGKYSCEYQENGIAINFQFDEQDFEIPCYFGLEDDHFVAKIISDQVKQYGKLQVSAVSLLPFFGAGGLEDTGYLVVPDGSGALISFNNQKQGYQSYSQNVYGRDYSLNLQNTTLVTENATMPVFGIRKNDAAMLAVISEGEYQAQINAEVARKRTSNNTVYSTVNYVQSESNTLLAGGDNEEVFVMLSKQQNQYSDYAVSYYFLDKGAGYSDMAVRYRNYLKSTAGMEDRRVSQKAAELSFIGGIDVRKTMLGVPYRTVEALTSFESLTENVSELLAGGADSFQVSMNWLEKGGSEGKISDRVSFDKALGGKKGYNAMKKKLSEADIPFYPVYDPVTIRHNGNGYSSYKAARNITRSAAAQYDYLLSSGNKDAGKKPDYLLSPKYVTKVMSELLESAEKKGVKELGLAGMAQKVYSDFGSAEISRNEAGDLWEKALGDAAKATDSLMVRGANAYAFPYADVLTEVPTDCSDYDVEDGAIPFYQIVMSGSSAMYSKPVNVNGNIRDALLRSVEYGVSPSFLCMSAGTEALQDTDYQQYFSISFDSLKEQIQEAVKELDGLTVLGEKIKNHSCVENGVYVTSFENGSDVYVNYNKTDVTVNGITIPAKGFVEGRSVE